MLWVLVYIIVFLLLLVYLEHWQKHGEFEKIPGPRGILFAANALDFLMDPVKLFYYFRTLANKYKQLFKLKLGTKKFVVLYNPEDVEVVLSGIKHNSKGFLYGFIQPWLQDGLLLSDGTKWQHRRKILTPTFHFNILRHFHVVIEENSKQLVESLKTEVGKPKTDVVSLISDFTLNSICETAMGIKFDKETSDLGRRYKDGIYSIGQLMVYRAQRVWMYPNWLFPLTDVGRKQKKLLDLLSSFRDNVINKRRESTAFQYIDVEKYDDDPYNSSIGKKRLVMLDLLLQAEKSGTIDAKGIGEEVDTFMFEGHDTTSTALQFAFMALANYPDVQEKAVGECNQIFGDSDRPATMHDLGQMKYLECIIKETMRLYPPVHFIMRKFNHPVKFKNYEVPAGTDCAILVYDLHRRADQFQDALAFKPERFFGEPTWHPYCYIPFSAGPRNCIGQKFAMMEMKLCLSAVLRRFKLLPVTKPQDVVFITDFILRTNHQIYVKFEKRN
uniref:cytochrome P450 4C1-like n=1 Tax=Pectinophora gossypiella TaxID=13191 RepID=UPI003B75B4C6